MARSKKSGPVNGHKRTPSPESERPAGPLSIVVSPEERDVVKVNNFNSTELKNACDDALRRVSLAVYILFVCRLLMPSHCKSTPAFYLFSDVL